MPENPTTKAIYDPNRDPKTGHFRKGHTLGGQNTEVARRFAELKSLWYDANSVSDMVEVKAELKKLCTSCPNPEVKLRAIIYYLDRTLGKPTERVEMDVATTPQPMPVVNLTAAEIAVLEKIVLKTEGDVFDADFSVND